MTAILFSIGAHAQEKALQRDSIDQKSLLGKLGLKKGQAMPGDTLPSNVAGIDSAKAKAANRVDSLRKIPSMPADKLDSLQRWSSARMDSLKNILQLPALKFPGDSLQQKLTTNITGATEKVQHAEDRLQAGVDSLGNKVTVAGNKVQQSIENKVQKITGEKIDIPDQKLPATPDIQTPGNISIPSVDKSVPSVEGLKTPEIAVPSANVEDPVDTKIDQPSVKVPDVSDKVKVPGEIENIQEEAGKIGDDLKEAEQYSDEAAKLKEQGLQNAEKLPETAEEKITDLAEVQDVKKDMGAVTAKQQEYEAMINRYKDKKLVQSEMKRKITNVVNDQLNQLSPEVKKAQASFAKSKKLYSEANSLSSAMKKKKTNAMAGKSFGQRLVPGLTFQAYNRSVYSVDWGLQLGYRLTVRLTAGVGGTYRTGFSRSYDFFVKGLNVYGGRVYADFLVRKGFFLHGECEMLNTSDFVPASSEVPDAKVWGSNIGIGKQFNLTKRIKGNLLALYRLEFHGHLPEQSKINLRMGFDLRPRKKNKISTAL